MMRLYINRKLNWIERYRKISLLLGIVLIGLLITLVQFVISRSTGEPDEWALPIVPHPQEIRLKDEQHSFVLNQNTKIIICSDSASVDCVEAELLNSALNQKGMNPLKVAFTTQLVDATNAIIISKLNKGDYFVDNIITSKNIGVTTDYPGAEGYIIDVSPNFVVVAGRDRAGTFYGVQSLIQLIFQDGKTGQLKIKPATIIDYPDMPLRSAFYGFYLNALEDDSLIERAHVDLIKIARFKFNMIDLASHHYGHLQMEVPGHSGEQLWQRFAKLYELARRYKLRPRVGGWAKWVNTKSPWGADLTTLECIRTSQIIKMNGTAPYTLKISSGQDAPNVIFDFASGNSWEQEPVIVTNESGTIVYQEGKDYAVNFGKIHSEDYQKYYDTPQTYLEVLFSELHYGEGEPAGYPLRWAETFNPSTTIQRLEVGRIQDGQTVKVTFSYIGPDPWSLIKVRYCRSDSRLHTDGPDNYIWRWCTEPIRFLGADDFSLDVDETRVFAWDKRCSESGKSRSRIWVDDISYYYETIRGSNPNARISMWSDMLDPGHNATLYGTEEAASIIVEYGMTDIIMIPWKKSIAQESVSFFANKELPIMPSCQGLTDAGISEAPKWAKLLRDFYAHKGIPFGLMHCHWGYAFDSDLTWEQLATVADHAWSVAPYILHKPVTMAKSGRDISIVAQFEGDKYVYNGKKTCRGPLPIKVASLYYKTEDSFAFTKVEMFKQGREFKALIPGSEVKYGNIEYYLAMSDESNTSYCPKLAERMPFKIRISNTNKTL